MVEYDDQVIAQHAAELYSRARRIVFVWTTLGLIAGGLGSRLFLQSTVTPWLGAVVVGILGYYAASGRAFALRLQAQMALCQRQIELNTRPARHVHQRGVESLVDTAAITQEPEPAVADGQCPNCDLHIPMSTPKCLKCGADFGPYSAWKVRPLSREAA